MTIYESRARAAVVASVLAVLLIGLLIGLLAAAPAQAHSDLLSSDPADGATLDQAPTQVSLTFNEKLLAQGNAVTVTEVATDQRLTVGAAQTEGPTVSVAWPQASPAGEFRAAYRVVSADGHPINGTITFTVARSAEGAPSADQPTAVAATGQAVGGQSPVPDPLGPTQDASPEPAGTPADPDEDSGGGSLLRIILGLGVAIVLGALGGTWFTRRAR